jgi:TRAP-type mannitol/chloroaromatic compound transport system substrate-binding protein
MYAAGGIDTLNAFFKDFGVIAFPAGNNGAQMRGWFRNPVSTPADFKGLKMRIPGLGGQVMARLGAVPQALPGGDIYPALERGAIDATEWVGRYDDEKLGFYKIAKHYYSPGWWEPCSMYHVMVNLQKWAELPKAYQEAIISAVREANCKWSPNGPAAAEGGGRAGHPLFRRNHAGCLRRGHRSL